MLWWAEDTDEILTRMNFLAPEANHGGVTEPGPELLGGDSENARSTESKKCAGTYERKGDTMLPHAFKGALVAQRVTLGVTVVKVRLTANAFAVRSF
jgi:hypothetical protein